jgi:threonine dehydrogenase-like Zn-dependent dehydrogenase
MRRVASVARIASGLGALGVACMLLAGAAPAEPYAVGSTVAVLELPDQHDAVHRIDATTRAVLLSRDMDGGGHVREALASDGASQLTAAGAVYVADVSGMPALIRRMIAIPRMRGRVYPVLLDTDGGPTAPFPAQDGQATWIRLDGLRVSEIRFLGSAEEVKAALAAAGSPPGE